MNRYCSATYALIFMIALILLAVIVSAKQMEMQITSGDGSPLNISKHRIRSVPYFAFGYGAFAA